MNKHIIRFPKDGQASLVANEWQVWNGELDEGAPFKSPDQAHHLNKVLVPFHWWITHYKNGNIIERANKGEIGVWFATDDDILEHAEIIEAGEKIWPVVAAHFPIFRDGRSFSTAALLRQRFNWQNEVRAIGDVLIDQLLQGARVGFDAFEMRADQDLPVGLAQFDLFSVTTQNSWRGKRTLLEA